MRCSPWGKVERQRDHKADSAYTVGLQRLVKFAFVYAFLTATMYPLLRSTLDSFCHACWPYNPRFVIHKNHLTHWKHHGQWLLWNWQHLTAQNPAVKKNANNCVMRYEYGHSDFNEIPPSYFPCSWWATITIKENLHQTPMSRGF